MESWWTPVNPLHKILYLTYGLTGLQSPGGVHIDFRDVKAGVSKSYTDSWLSPCGVPLSPVDSTWTL